MNDFMISWNSLFLHSFDDNYNWKNIFNFVFYLEKPIYIPGNETKFFFRTNINRT